MAEPVPRTDIADRVKAFQAALRGQGVHVALVQQNSDLFYLTGAVAEGVLALPAEGEGAFFVRRPFSRTKDESSFQPVVPFEKDQVAALRARGVLLPEQPTIGLETDVLPYAWAARTLRANQAQPSQVADVSDTLRGLRAVKSTWERRMHRQAAQIQAKAFAQVDALLKEGMREYELKAKIEAALRMEGAQGPTFQRRFNQEPFQGHVLSGESACLTSYQHSAMGGTGLSRRYPQDAGAKRMRRGEPVVVDLAIASNGYLADETRTFAIGSLPRELQEHYEFTVHVLEFLRGKLVPGADGAALFDAAEAEFGKKGLKDNLGGFGDDRVAFVGHGIGIELDELPVLARGVKSAVEVGHVVAVEPKLVFPKVGMVGVEDSHFITEGGAEVFTKTKYDTVG